LTDTNAANAASLALKLAPAARRMAQVEADKILQEIDGITAVVVATTDGFDIASALRSSLDPTRIAAMASSISAIAYVVSEEAKLGLGKRVTIETDAGLAVVVSVPRTDTELVLIVISDGRTLLGQIAYRTTAAAHTLLTAE
jgi:predicted regulator of Ras-like GTPase activity (Roadblock/LC7/MglB family)